MTDINTATYQLPQDADIETVELDNPILRGEQTINTLTIRKPKTGALRGLALTKVLELDVDTLAKLIPRVTSPVVVEHEINQLDLSDFTKVATAVVGFFANTAERAAANSQSASTM